MFFRRTAQSAITFDERLAALKRGGFRVEPAGPGRYEARRGNCRAVLSDPPQGPPRVERSGIVFGGGIATLVDAGFMKMLETQDGTRRAALASDLKELQAFREDLREALGLESLYNESLGTVSERHTYDRLKGR
jgi:hypothetical protein